MRRYLLFLLIFLALSLTPLAPDGRVHAQEQLCFPETGQCIAGRFRTYWEQNGGLPVFGFSITPARDEVNRDTGQTYLTQWLERNRFELHRENQPPYDVLLGRLGDDRLRQKGIDWRTLPRESGARAGCRWFDQTGHNVCDQGNGVGFKTYWESHGLEFDGRPGKTYAESLALFGLPLTEPRSETNASGDTVLTQWFERARFEWHPGKPDEFKVLLGLLGSELRAPGAGAPPAPPATIEYTALGDSLATGILASQGYVRRYADHLQADIGRPVKLNNLGRNGWTSGDLLNALKTNQTFRDSVARAHVVTWNIGGNDFNQARQRYKARACGGADNQDCLRSAVATFKANWDAIIGEILSLRSPGNTLIRTMDVYNPYVNEDRAADTWAQDGGLNDFQVFKPYLDGSNSHIATTATGRSIPYTRVYQAFNGSNGDEDPNDKSYITFDRYHLRDAAHQVMAELLLGLQYAPLK